MGRKKRVRIPIKECFYILLYMDNPDQPLFENPVMENSQTNKYLKAIMRIVDINKNISFHKARYTFGINSLILGVDIAAVSNILGHSELPTTQSYAKVVDKHRNKEMSKWGSFRKNPNDSNTLEIKYSNCDTILVKTEQGVIAQKHIKCTCYNCSSSTLFELTVSE